MNVPFPLPGFECYLFAKVEAMLWKVYFNHFRVYVCGTELLCCVMVRVVER